MGKLCLFIVASCLLGCKMPPVEIPQGVLSQDSMVDIMVDVHLAEGGRSGGMRMYNEALIKDFYHAIYAKYDIDKERFEHSFNFYNQNPDIMLDMHDRVIRRLNEIDAQLEKALESSTDSIVQLKRDSITNDTLPELVNDLFSSDSTPPKKQ